MNRTVPSILVALVSLLALAAPGVAATFPVTVIDDLGREVTLAAPPRRVISMIPSHTETTCALDACGLLVGVDEHSNHPAEALALPKLGSAFSADLEGIVALEPDLVLVDEYSGLAEQLAGLGVPVYAGTPQSYDEVFESFAVLGKLLGREAEASLLAERIRGEVEAVAEAVSELPSPSVYLEIDATPYSVGPGSYVGTLIDAAGGRNIVPAELGDYPQLDPEFVVEADPDVIILADAPYGESASTLAARPGWAGLGALAAGRVAELTQEQVDALNRPGPRLAEAVRILAEIIHPAAF